LSVAARGYRGPGIRRRGHLWSNGRVHQISPGAPVLIVDDDAELRHVLVDVLRAEGIPAVPAFDGAAARTLITGGLRPSAVLLDVRMPMVDGRELLAWLLMERARLGTIPVVIMTAMDESLRLPPDVLAVLRKPFEPSALLDVLRRVRA
jgi:two-component system, OmpR family, response regulator CpxR